MSRCFDIAPTDTRILDEVATAQGIWIICVCIHMYIYVYVYV